MQVFQKGIWELCRVSELCRFFRREFGNYVGFWNYVGFPGENAGITYFVLELCRFFRREFGNYVGFRNYVGFSEGNLGIT